MPETWLLVSLIWFPIGYFSFLVWLWSFLCLWRLDQLRLDYAAATAAFDAVLLPTVKILPPKIDAVTEDADYFVAQNLLTLANTRIGNLMGLAGVTLPTGAPSSGLLIQGPGEERLLRVARAIEAALA